MPPSYMYHRVTPVVVDAVSVLVFDVREKAHELSKDVFNKIIKFDFFYEIEKT
jgi:hypothetical protein